MYLIWTILILILLYFIYKISYRVKQKNSSNLLIRFRRIFKKRNVLKERISERHINELLSDPKNNISIGTWYTENELRERADIHRARLSKFGCSKMNGEMLFLSSHGRVYKITPDGKRNYV